MNQSAIDEILNVPLLSGVDSSELLRSLEDCEVKEYKAGHYICRQGEYDENCSIILSGSASVELPQEGGKRSQKITLKPGEMFGEIAALSGNPRTANIVAERPTALLNISRRNLFQLLDKFPTVKGRLDILYRERALSSHLLTIPVFAGISEEFLKDLITKVALDSFAAGTVIFRQGDDADVFYLVRYGFVKITERDGDGKEKVLAYLKDGHYFGEMALLIEGEKRSATVSAINRVEVIGIFKRDFQELLQSHPEVKSNLEKIIEKRKERNIRIRQDVHLEKSLSAAIDSGVLQTKAVLIMDTTKCVQCDNCVKACAALHDNQARLIRKGKKLNNFLLLPTSCRHCEDPTCMSKCPTGAISRDFSGEIYHKDFCVGCGNCAKNCPFGNILVVTVSDNGQGKKSLPGIFSFFKGNGKTESPAPPSEPARLVFPGDRDMASQGNSGKFLGDRDMFSSASTQKKSKPRRKATKCDMCRDYPFMGCVYNCPSGAARRVDPTEFFVDLAAVG